MGCDLLATWEMRDPATGTWRNLDTWELDDDADGEGFIQTSEPILSERNDVLFAVLGGVYRFLGRDYGAGIKPIAKPKGFPKDAAPETNRFSDDYTCDQHSHSWLTLAEILKYNFKWRLNGEPLIDLVDELRDSAIPRMREQINAANLTPDDIRIVFFFDN